MNKEGFLKFLEAYDLEVIKSYKSQLSKRIDDFTVDNVINFNNETKVIGYKIRWLPEKDIELFKQFLKQKLLGE